MFVNTTELSEEPLINGSFFVFKTRKYYIYNV